ncbi:MAG: hypothetical protein L0212_08610 [Acidobacteria bacterium]|nr:hypothetical protein [Acidobacteriota bacterium]
MAKRYAVQGSQNVASPTDSVLGVTGTTAVRPEIYDLIFGSSATPADNALNWLVQRYTVVGAGTTVTPQSLDPNEVAATFTSLSDHTTEPTYTAGAILLNISANQRSTQRWVAAPNGALKIPATANNGLGVQPVHSSFTGLVECTCHVEE